MQSMTPQQVRDATLMLRRPTVVDQIQEKVPLPKGSVPRNGLPYWNKIPLGSKLPIIEHPKDAFVFYRDKLGKKLWRPSPVHAFRLDDPYCRDVEYKYDALHDPCLANMFRSEEHRHLLLSRGFILPTLEAVCSLKDFNTYRRYLQSIHRECIRDQYDRRAVDLSDEQAMRRARACEERQLEADRKRAIREEKHGEVRKALEAIRQEKLKQIMLRQEHYLQLIEKAEQAREEQRRQAVEHAREMDEKVRYRNAVAAEIQRAKVIATIQAWNRDEEERKARLEKQQLELQEFKEKQVEERWQSKIQCQLDREEQERRLLARQEEIMRLAVELRNKKIEREDLRMQALLKRIKVQSDKQRAKKMKMRPARRGRGRGGSRSATAGQRGRTSVAEQRHRRAQDQMEFDTVTSLERQVGRSLQIIRDYRAKDRGANLNDLWGLIQKGSTGESGEEEEDDGGAPKPVAQAIRFLLDRTMRQCVYNQVLATLRTVYFKAMGRCRRLLDEIPARELATRGWVCRHHLARPDKEGEGEGPGQPKSSASRRRSARGSSDTERKKIQEQIDALDKKNEQLKKILEQTGSASASGVQSPSSGPDSDQAETDLDTNFEVMAKHLLRKIVALAAQSLSDDTKVTTLHRWKLMKEVELTELTDRLCAMMMDHTPREFLPSAEFHWAADILARDVMKEVRCQIRREQRQRERAEQARRGREQATQLQRRSRSGPRVEVDAGSTRSEPSPERPVPTAPEPEPEPEPEFLDEAKVPLLRLHKRSPHQPSIPSLDSLS